MNTYAKLENANHPVMVFFWELVYDLEIRLFTNTDMRGIWAVVGRSFAVAKELYFERFPRDAPTCIGCGLKIRRIRLVDGEWWDCAHCGQHLGADPRRDISIQKETRPGDGEYERQH